LSSEAKPQDPAAESRVEELERELQDLAENSVKQMCILTEENRRLLEDRAQRGSKMSGGVKETLPRQTGKPSADTMGRDFQKREQEMSLIIDSLKAQLLQKDMELQASEMRVKYLNETHQQKNAAAMSLVDNGVDELSWLINELSLDRARHSLERAQAGVQVKRMHELNNIIYERIARVPVQVTTHGEGETATKNEHGLHAQGRSRRTVSGISAPPPVPKLPISKDVSTSIVKACPLDHSVSGGKAPLDQIPEEFEEYVQEAPEAPSSSTSQPGLLALQCRQVTPTQFFAGACRRSVRSGGRPHSLHKTDDHKVWC